MKRIILQVVLLVVWSCLPVLSFAQDVITKMDNTTIQAKVVEIGETQISYRSWDNLDGPLYKINKSSVQKIVYQNGREDVFQEQRTEPTVKSSTPSASTSGVSIPASGKMQYSRGDFTLNGEELSADQIRQLVGDEIYTKTYEGAVKQRKLGKILTIVGGATAGVGAGLFIGALISSNLYVTKTYYYNPKNPSQTWGHKTTYDDNLDKTMPVMIIGEVIMSVGLAALNAGIPLSIIGNKRLDWVATDYNQRNGRYALLNVGPTRYGFGVSLTF